jgi:hypothetical protein
VIEIDIGALLRRVILGDQSGNRGIDEGGIAEIARTIGIGPLHRLDQQMQRCRRALLQVARRKACQNVQRLQQHRAAR